MAVSKNKRKNDTAAKRHKRKLLEQKKRAAKKEYEMTKLIKEGFQSYDEIANDVNDLIGNYEKLSSNFKSAEYKEDVSEDEKAQAEKEFVLLDKLISEARTNLETSNQNVDKIRKEVDEKSVELVDANMELIEEVFKVQEHVKHIHEYRLDNVEKAYNLKHANNPEEESENESV